MPQEIQIPPSVVPPPAQPKQTRPTLSEVIFAVHETGVPPEPIPDLTKETIPKDRTQPQIPASARNIDVATLLRSPMGLRGAVILREILGPPRGLRAPDLMTVE
jgi:hypothetical protein